VPDAPRVAYAREAQRDLRRIYRWVERQSGRERARTLIASIRERCSIYAGAPLAGRLRPELAENVRSFVSDPYVVLYIPGRHGITVARVIHGYRDVTKAWREPD
jgi:toxin ParE1/3/4